MRDTMYGSWPLGGLIGVGLYPLECIFLVAQVTCVKEKGGHGYDSMHKPRERDRLLPHLTSELGWDTGHTGSNGCDG